MSNYCSEVKKYRRLKRGLESLRVFKYSPYCYFYESSKLDIHIINWKACTIFIQYYTEEAGYYYV